MAREGERRPESGRDLPLGRMRTGRLLPGFLALMVYVAGLGGLGLIALGGGVAAGNGDSDRTMTLDLPQGVSAARREVIMALLRETPGILGERVRAPAATTAATATPPPIVDLTIDPSRRIDMATLRHHLATVVPGARLADRPPLPPSGHRRATRNAIAIVALAAAIALLAALIVLSVVRTVAAGLTADRPTIELLHDLGAHDRTIAGWFARRAWWQGLGGGALGALGALATGLAVARLPGGVADPRIWSLVALLPPATGLVALAAARATVLRRLATRL